MIFRREYVLISWPTFVAHLSAPCLEWLNVTYFTDQIAIRKSSLVGILFRCWHQPARQILQQIHTTPSVCELFDAANESLFKTVLSDNDHVLHRLLTDNKTVSYNLRFCSHNLTLTCKSTFYDYDNKAIVLSSCCLSQCGVSLSD